MLFVCVVLSTNGPSHHADEKRPALKRNATLVVTSIGDGAKRREGILVKTNVTPFSFSSWLQLRRGTTRIKWTRKQQGHATGRSARFPGSARTGEHAGSPVMSRSAIKRQGNGNATVSTPKINRTFNTQQVSAHTIYVHDTIIPSILGYSLNCVQT